MVGAEKDILWGLLDANRSVLPWKLEGLTEEQARSKPLGSDTSLLGIVKHLAAVEYAWFAETFGRETEPLPDDADADFRIEDEETIESIVAFNARAVASSDTVIGDLELDAEGRAHGAGPPVSLRWVLAHMIEETARHAGHADAVRELIDGTTGYLPERA